MSDYEILLSSLTQEAREGYFWYIEKYNKEGNLETLKHWLSLIGIGVS